MSIFDKKGISLIDGFKLAAERPLDVRQVVESVAEREQLIAEHAVYPGLRVFVKETKCSYIYMMDPHGKK